MKKLLLSALLLLVFGSVSAQITLTKPANMKVGTKVRTTARSLNFTAENLTDTSGAGKTWDFSALTPAGPSETTEVEIVSVSATPYAKDFPNANLASKTMDKDTANYGFILLTDSELTVYGNAQTPAGPESMQKFKDPLTLMKFPFKYNDKFQDDFSVDAGGTEQVFKRESEYVGYGTVKTPAGTYPNVALIKTKQVLDLIFIKVTTIDYIWYDQDFNQLFSVNISEALGGLKGYSAIYTTYQPNSVGELILSGNDGLPYPNPATDEFSFHNPGFLKNATLSDLQGRTVYSSDLQPGTCTVSTEHMPAGLYTLRLTDADGKSNFQKIMVK